MSDAMMQMVGLGTMCLAAGIGLGAVGMRILEAIAERKAEHSPGRLDLSGCTFGRYA